MKYLLDSDTCIAFLRGKSHNVKAELSRRSPEQIGVSVITVYELIFGATKSGQLQLNMQIANTFLAPFDIFDLNSDIAEEYGDIRWDLEKRGMKIGANDLIIAAHARYLGRTLVTGNTREFQRVAGLSIENWM